VSGPTNNGDAWMYGVVIIEKDFKPRKDIVLYYKLYRDNI